jgi:hypothetical protein
MMGPGDATNDPTVTCSFPKDAKVTMWLAPAPLERPGAEQTVTGLRRQSEPRRAGRAAGVDGARETSWLV